MKTKLCVAIATLTALTLIAGACPGADPPKKGLLEELALPMIPGTKLLTEINLPTGKLLDSIVEEFGPWLGLSEVTRLRGVNYAIHSAMESEQVFKVYEPPLAEQQWKTIIHAVLRDSVMAVLFNEKRGMLIIGVAAPGEKDRELFVMQIFGKVDPAKFADPERKLPALLRKIAQSGALEETPGDVRTAARIPIGQPISVPPSEKLHIKATRSDIKARVLDQNTAEIRLASRSDDPGELVRIDERLVLALTPKVAVDEVILPGTFPLLLELTEGSLALACGSGPNDRPVRLSVVSTGAPVALESFPLVSGTHTVKVLGGDVRIALSAVSGGALEVEVTGDDVILALPRDASATVTAAASTGSIENLTGLAPLEAAQDRMVLQFGAGKAAISVRAINGRVSIRVSQ